MVELSAEEESDDFLQLKAIALVSTRAALTSSIPGHDRHSHSLGPKDESLKAAWPESASLLCALPTQPSVMERLSPAFEVSR